MRFKIEEREDGLCRVYYKKWWMLWRWGYVTASENLESFDLHLTYNLFTSQYYHVPSIEHAYALVDMISNPKGEEKEKVKIYYID